MFMLMKERCLFSTDFIISTCLSSVIDGVSTKMLSSGKIFSLTMADPCSKPRVMAIYSLSTSTGQRYESAESVPFD